MLKWFRGFVDGCALTLALAMAGVVCLMCWLFTAAKEKPRERTYYHKY